MWRGFDWPSDHVPPAQAGMLRAECRSSKSAAGFPRAGGDEPVTSYTPNVNGALPPRRRGLTMAVTSV